MRSWHILIALTLASIALSVFSLVRCESFESLSLNLGTELMGAVVTYLLFDRLIGLKEKEREKRSQLIRDLYSSENRIRDLALREMIEKKYLIGADLRFVNLRGASLKGADLSNANLYGADLFGADLTNCNLSQCILGLVNLQGSHLIAAILQEADLQSADLRGAFLNKANLRKANLTKANLAGANLIDADLMMAKLEDATVAGTQLHGCKIEENDKNDLSLRGAKL